MLVTNDKTKDCADRFMVRSREELLERLNSPAADIIVMTQEHALNLMSLMFDVPIQSKRLRVARKLASTQVTAALQETGLFHQELSDEMVRTVKFFGELFGQEQMEVRWDVTDQQSCPKFHCDNVSVRLLVTYFGPTTEFIDQNEPGVIYRVPLNAFVFLKGHKHPTYRDRVLHRSPEIIEGEKRFCMVVNFCDWLPKR